MIGDGAFRVVPVGELDVELPPAGGDLLFEGVLSGAPVDLGGLCEIRRVEGLGAGGLGQRCPGQHGEHGAFGGAYDSRLVRRTGGLCRGLRS
ncbi:hypothetical protein [Lentzea albidocapillata]|uniref:hypothetical protein n=1 Tax=Lentzea albidocapillata TaxID=40571 RepID=UPI001FE8B853|nr:hypothetical protein [Lentzea albidocapillata]